MMASKDLFNIKLLFYILSSTPKWKIGEAGLRIIGGRNALKNEFPFAVRLEEQNTEIVDGKTHVTYLQFCTGAALTSTWILTAAHCDDDDLSKMNHFLITAKPPKFARYNSYFPEESGHLSPITKVVTYPGYSSFASKYDAALFQTNNVMISAYGKISAIDYTNLIGHEAVVLGFGGTNASSEEKPLQVLKGMLTRCDEYLEGGSHGTLCVVPRCGLEATVCGGDSGGPVMHATGIIGVTSQSWGNCDEFSHQIYPGYAADEVSVISPIIDWISTVIAGVLIERHKY